MLKRIFPWLFWALLLAGGCDRADKEAIRDPEFIRQMNLGQAYLENRKQNPALAAYGKAVERAPKSALALRNLARAQMLARKEPEALQTLHRAVKLEPESAAAHYLMGMSHLRSANFPAAVEPLESSARLDPDVAPTRFQLAIAYQGVKNSDQAQEQLRETVRLDPLHISAHYKLANHARHNKDTEGQARHNREFMRLLRLFGNAGRTAEALEMSIHTRAEPFTPPSTPEELKTGPEPLKVHFSDVTQQVFATDIEHNATLATLLTVDQRGQASLFLIDEAGKAALLSMGENGRFQRVSLPLEAAPSTLFTMGVAGNFQDLPPLDRNSPVPVFNDILLMGPERVRLLRQNEAALFEDVTVASGIGGQGAEAGRWVDFEHDGDLDLLLARKTGLQLWQNNGAGGFEEVSDQVGLVGGEGATDLLAVDLKDDVAIDLLMANPTQGTQVFKNQRAGRFAPLTAPVSPWPTARRLLADDLDNDGHADVLLVRDQELLILYGGGSRRDHLTLADFLPKEAALMDYDNDGWLDVVAFGSRKESPVSGLARLWRNDRGKGWREVSSEVGLTSISLAPVRQVVAADLDGDNDTDLLLVTANQRMRLLRNEGGHVNGQLKVRLLGTKSNPSGFGAKVDLRAAAFRVSRVVTGVAVELGLAGHQQLDSLRATWTNGVMDNRMEVTVPGEPVLLEEPNVATGSCPLLYAWDGNGFRFVTDILGNAPLGLSLRRDVILPADPEELVWMGDESQFPLRNGRYVVQVGSEFREALYLDQARLMVVDHPEAVEVHPTDKLQPPPFPPSEVWGASALRLPHYVMGDDGVDRTVMVEAVDGRFAPPGRPLPLRGMTYPLTVTLDFGPLDYTRPLMLALTGWLQYGDASTNIAVSQNPAMTVIPPTLEAQTADGLWHPVAVTIGMPAGKTKTILTDLTGKLPAATERLRLTSTFEIRWDRIALFERYPEAGMRVQYLEPSAARLFERGFSEIRSRAPGHPTTPDHAEVARYPQWGTTLEGWCTRYGDVLELVTQQDQRLLIANAGDAVEIHFDPEPLGPVPEGHKRSFFFYSVGWDKDGDHNVIAGDRIAPLPVTVSSDDDWWLKYNTRWVPGNLMQVARE